MQHRISRAIGGCLVACALLAGTAARADAVANGGFETGDFTGWTQHGDTSFNGVDTLAPHSGQFAGFFGPVGATGGISQLLATTPGAFYDIEFWLKNEADVQGAVVPNSFDFSWNGVSQFSLTDEPSSEYTKHTFTLQALSASTELKFNFGHGPAYWDLDDVAAVQRVPEPVSLALAGLAVGLVAVQRRRRSKFELVA